MDNQLKLDKKTQAVFTRKGYKIEKQLGHGNYGYVYRAIDTTTGEKVAVKVTDMEKVNKVYADKFLTREMATMIKANHDNIIKVFDIIKANKKIFIFMEFAGNGDLMQYMKKYGKIGQTKACYWFNQVANGLTYLHEELYIAHRDIKLDNILLNSEMSAKISDFGFARKAYDPTTGEVMKAETICGTRMYFCPQLFRKQPYDPYKADVWAMGVVLFSMINDKLPFHVDNDSKTISEMKDKNYLETRYTIDGCEHLKQLIRSMFEFEETDRCDIKTVLDNKWITEKAKCCEN
ncbi:testis-specific serine/threonine-protein kinase 4-like [Oppia nitens]|uniref:testis-specific serine/threonine-protein kinase 4-like n=1 Tax=Oppia nitens TaxID=1686743 RepID=UPI0023DB5CDE|nr:testis-specific serine/threonine-protein kinase 4-like [Oppia nitens]